MRRREFVTLAGGVAAWPLAARAQQSRVPVIGYLSARSAASDVEMVAALRRGLSETGYVEGRNLAIEYRYADGQYDHMPSLLAELARRRVGVIVAVGITGEETMLRALRASQIPIVFNMGPDPVRMGVVDSLAKPGGNLTGHYVLIEVLYGKNLSLLSELVPGAKTIAMLFNPSGGNEQSRSDAHEAANRLGLRLIDLPATTDDEIEAAFATLQRQPVDAMLSGSSPLFMTRARKIAALAASHRLPTIFFRREFAEAGGLMSYGYDVHDGYRHMGMYAGRILRGEKPADLPVFQPTKFQFVINLKTAKALGIEIPAKLLALSDEVIE